MRYHEEKLAGHTILKSPLGYLRFTALSDTEYVAELLSYTDDDLDGPRPATAIMKATSRKIGLTIKRLSSEKPEKPKPWAVVNDAGDEITQRFDSCFSAMYGLVGLSLPHWLVIEPQS